MPSLLSEEEAAGSAAGTAVKMSELNNDKKYKKPEVEQEKLRGTGLLSEEHRERRESLVKKTMRDIIVDPQMQEQVTPGEAAQQEEKKKGALGMTGLEAVELKQVAAQKGVANTAHLDMPQLKAERSTERMTLTAQSALSPEWNDALGYMRLMLTLLGAGAKLPDETPPNEAYAKVVAACKKTAKKPELPPTKHEEAGNTEKRKKVQRGCQSLVIPYSEFEVPGTFNQRLEAVKRLSALREGPHVVPVLPQRQAETPTQARMRLDAQTRCCTAVLPVSEHENADAYEERLDACRLIPTKLTPPTGGSTGGTGAGQERLRPWPLLPKGRHESGASFTLRLEASRGASVPVLPQSHGEADEQAARRFKAQQHAPHAMLWPYHPQLETVEMFEQRCAELMPGLKPKRKGKEKRRGTALSMMSERMSAMLSVREFSDRSGRSRDRMSSKESRHPSISEIDVASSGSSRRERFRDAALWRPGRPQSDSEEKKKRRGMLARIFRPSGGE